MRQSSGVLLLAVLCGVCSQGPSFVQGQPPGSHHLEACQAVATQANQGRLDSLAVRFGALEETEVPQHLKMPPINFSLGIAKVDMNHDGRPDYVGLTSEGTAHAEGLRLYDSEGQAMPVSPSADDDWESPNLRWALDRRVISYKDRVYILGKTGDDLYYLSFINEQQIEKVVCEFAQKQKPVEKIVRSTHDQLCQLALTGSLEYATFDKLHSLTAMVQTTPGDWASRIDIDNDGHEDYVVQLQFASGAGRGCDFDALAMLNAARNDVDRGVIGQLLHAYYGGEGRGSCGGARSRPFTFAGQVFIEDKYPEKHPFNYHKIAQIKNGRLDTVCEYDVRVINDVLDDYERIVHAAEAAYQHPLLYALERPTTTALEILLARGSNANALFAMPGGSNVSVLYEAIRQQRDEALVMLLKHGVDPNLIIANHDTALLAAIRWRTQETVRQLLQHGADPNLMGALASALFLNALDKLQLLLEYGGDPNAPGVLETAVGKGRTAGLALLLKHGAMELWSRAAMICWR